MQVTQELGHSIGNLKEACEALNVPKASFYRALQANSKPGKKRLPPLSLSQVEEQEILDILHSERFQDKAPYEIYANLLDEGKYICSIRSMYRVLEKHKEIKERRKHVSRKAYKKPELLATAPNQVWSWDITKLKGPAKWSYFYLYVILDIFSRYVVGWMVADRESSSLAKQLIQESCEKQGIVEEQLTLHADRGPSMKSKTIAQLLADLGITKTHNRPYTSNDNPYSESQFKTLKYHPIFPDCFGSLQDARAFCQIFFTWYNIEHIHTGISLLTPEQVHYGMDKEIIERRNRVLEEAFYNNPKRFKNHKPTHPEPPKAVWINKPKNE